MPRPKTYDATHRTQLIERAAAAIAERGIEDLSLRALAADAGLSTTAVYSLIGEKSELIAAVGREASNSFTAAQRAAVTGSDPVTDLRLLGLAYRRWALENPSLYAVMFTGRIPPESCESDQAITPLLDVVTRLHASGRLAGEPGDVAGAALAIWAAVHGMVSLQLALTRASSPDDGARDFDRVLEATERAWVLPPR